MKLLLFEYKKLFSFRTLMAILAAVLLQIGFSLIPLYDLNEYTPEIYKKYIAEIGGEFTEEKYSYIRERHEEIQQIIACHDEISQAYTNGKITLDEFSAHNDAYVKALNEEKTIAYLLKKSEYFAEIGGECIYFYDTDWENFLSQSSFNFITAFLIIFLSIPVFCTEYQSGSRAVLYTSLRGRKELCICKLISAFSAAFILSFVLYLIRYGAFHFMYEDLGNYPIRNLIDHSGYGYISLRQYYFNDTLIKSAAWAMSSLFVCAVSGITRNAVFTAFLSFIPIAAAALVPELSEGALRYVFLGSVLSENYAFDFSIVLFLLVMLIKAVAYSWVSIMRWKSTEL